MPRPGYPTHVRSLKTPCVRSCDRQRHSHRTANSAGRKAARGKPSQCARECRGLLWRAGVQNADARKGTVECRVGASWLAALIRPGGRRGRWLGWGELADVGVPLLVGEIAAGDPAGGVDPVVGFEVPDLHPVRAGDRQPRARSREGYDVQRVVGDAQRGAEAHAGGDVVERHGSVAGFGRDQVPSPVPNTSWM